MKYTCRTIIIRHVVTSDKSLTGNAKNYGLLCCAFRILCGYLYYLCLVEFCQRKRKLITLEKTTIYSLYYCSASYYGIT